MYEDIEIINGWIDSGLPEVYRPQPLARDWARVAKIAEEAGECADALMGMTGGNPRKGVCKSLDDVLGELADVVVTGLAAIQHFTGDRGVTRAVVEKRIAVILERVGLQAS